MPDSVPDPKWSALAAYFRATADEVERGGIDLESLCQGPLGEMLTMPELRELADDREAVDKLIAGCRRTADDYEERTNA